MILILNFRILNRSDPPSGRTVAIAPRQRQDQPFAPDHEADVRLVEAILAGSEPAWHTFIDRYTGLLLHVLRRYLFDEDQVRGAYVDILENLHNGRLRTYEGRSRLSTWLLLVARNAATDTLRHEHGRREMPRGLRRLSDLHQEVYRLYYVQGETFTATRKQLVLLGHDLDQDALVDILADIDDQVTDRSCRRLRYDLAAESVGAASGRLLEFCDAARLDAEETGRRLDPLEKLMAREAELRALKALRLVAELPPEERRIMSLRFEEGLTADQIAARLGIANRRRVFTMLESIIRRLRRRHAEMEKSTVRDGNSDASAVPQPENAREVPRLADRPPRAAGD